MAEDLAEFRDDVRAFFGRRVGAPADADDLTQDTFVRALVHWGDLRQPAARRSWLFSIAHNVLRDHLRDGRRAPVPEAEPDAGGAFASLEPGLRAAIRTGLDALPTAQRHVLLLRLLGDLTFAEIARRLGIPEATAHTRAYYGLRRLRAAVAAGLQREGLLVDCATVRDRLLRLGFGLGREDAAEEVERHLAACPACAGEAEVLRGMVEEAAVEARSAVFLQAFDLKDTEGNGSAYFLASVVNTDEIPSREWGVNTGGDPDACTYFDAEGRQLVEARRWRMDDGRYGLRYTLHEPWQPGAALRVVGRQQMWRFVRPAGTGWCLVWSNRPLDADSEAREVLDRRVVQLPAGYRAVAADPLPDHALGDGRVLTWSAVVPRGQTFDASVTFARAADAVRLRRYHAPALRFETGAATKEQPWRWSDPTAPYLVDLRREQRLDAVVAGARDDFDKAVRVCHWVHGLWEHDGRNESEKRDPRAILREVAQGRRFRCVEYSVVIGGCLNALGVRSRLLGLMAADVETRESGAGHVVVEAYLADRRRWVLVAGQWDAVADAGAVAFQAALATGGAEPELISLSGTRLEDYAAWVVPYLHFFRCSYDNRVEVEDRAKGQVVLVPLGAAAPRVFQRKWPISGAAYTHSPADLYPVP